VSSSFLYCRYPSIPALPCAISTCSLIYFLYTRFAAALVFCDTTLLSLSIQYTKLPLSSARASRAYCQKLHHPAIDIPYCEHHRPHTQAGRGTTLPSSQTLNLNLYCQDRQTHLPSAITSHDQTSSANPARTNPHPQTKPKNGPLRDSASKARDLPPGATLHPPRQAQHLGLGSAIRQRRVRLRQRVNRHITHIQHQQQRGRLHREDGRRQSRRGLFVERRSPEEQSLVKRGFYVRVEGMSWRDHGMSTN
jgi:hypothetical protein